MFNVVPDMSPFADRIGGDKVAERLSLSHHLRKLPATLVFMHCTSGDAPLMNMMMSVQKARAPVRLGISRAESPMYFVKPGYRDAALIGIDTFLTQQGFLQGKATVSSDKTSHVYLQPGGPGTDPGNPGFETNPGFTPPDRPAPDRPGLPKGQPPVPPGVQPGGQAPPLPGVPPQGAAPGLPVPPGVAPPPGATPPAVRGPVKQGGQ
jgi:hypothetical protein